MQFLYDENAGKNELLLENEAFHHLKVRRVQADERLNLRNLKDDFLYTYQITKLSRNSCTLMLREKTLAKAQMHANLSLALGVIDPKNIEKALPFLNELGLAKLIFVYSEFSQAHFKPCFARFERILISSCEQCGRSDIMQFECFKSVAHFAKAYPKAIMLDFSAENDDFSALSENDIIFVGAEGGFSDTERALFERKIRLKSPYILRSQSALVAVAAKILL